ncbi:MAG: hypothetical protein ABJH05_07155 [Fulvivirga sp.]
MSKLSFFLLLALSINAFSQTTFTDKKGKVHLAGPFQLNTLESDTSYSSWYHENYTSFQPKLSGTNWIKHLKDVHVDIYMGTWCGDTKYWVPRFVKLWDTLNLKRSQLTFTALYNSSIEGKYKQGPHEEEKGLKIHRVPVFIFRRAGKEIGRIVEYPVTDLETDVAQIALGFPTAPNYKAAAYLMNQLADQPLDSIRSNINRHFYEVYERVGKSNELNTLGYVYKAAGKLDNAELVFFLNTYLYRYNPNVYDSYAEILAAQGRNDEAIENYKKVLAINSKDEHALAEIERLEELQNQDF